MWEPRIIGALLSLLGIKRIQYHAIRIGIECSSFRLKRRKDVVLSEIEKNRKKFDSQLNEEIKKCERQNMENRCTLRRRRLYNCIHPQLVSNLYDSYQTFRCTCLKQNNQKYVPLSVSSFDTTDDNSLANKLHETLRELTGFFETPSRKGVHYFGHNESIPKFLDENEGANIDGCGNLKEFPILTIRFEKVNNEEEINVFSRRYGQDTNKCSRPKNFSCNQKDLSNYLHFLVEYECTKHWLIECGDILKFKALPQKNEQEGIQSAFQELYDGTLGDNGFLKEWKRTTLHQLRLEYAKSVENFVEKEKLQCYLKESLEAWSKLRTKNDGNLQSLYVKDDPLKTGNQYNDFAKSLLDNVNAYIKDDDEKYLRTWISFSEKCQADATINAIIKFFKNVLLKTYEINKMSKSQNVTTPQCNQGR